MPMPQGQKPLYQTYIESHNTINNECCCLLDHAICTNMQWQNILRVRHIFLGDIHHLTYANCMFPCNPNLLDNLTPLLASNRWACHSMLWLQNQVIHGNPYRPDGDTASYVLHSWEHNRACWRVHSHVKRSTQCNIIQVHGCVSFYI